MSEGQRVALDAGPMVAGGEALCRAPGGEIILVEGALPGERVVVQVAKVRRGGVRRGRVVEVVEPAPERVEVACPAYSRGCGGCRWLHMDGAAQARHKAGIVIDALERISGFETAEVTPHTPAEAGEESGRSTVRLAVRDGRAGHRRHRSNGIVEVETCPAAHPLLAGLITADYRGAQEVTLRCGARTGERLALVDPDAWDVDLAPDVTVVGTDELQDGFGGRYHEEVAGRRWRISAPSFFQAHAEGAEALAGAVVEACDDMLVHTELTLVDAYCGVGLLGGAIATARPGALGRVVAVEEALSSVSDARFNLADLDAEVVGSDVAAWRPVPADIVVADPARKGLGPQAAEVLTATGAARLVLVGCDAAAFARDARLLVDAGWTMGRATLVDMFPDTPHVEVVGRFDRR